MSEQAARAEAWEHVMGRHLTNAVRELWRTFAELFNPYHPELHYMRGPGPKWHAKRPGS
jgi:hypothetical protein